MGRQQLAKVGCSAVPVGTLEAVCYLSFGMTGCQPARGDKAYRIIASEPSCHNAAMQSAVAMANDTRAALECR